MANQTNLVVLTGRLTTDPEEIKTKKKGLSGAKFSIANNRMVNKEEETSFFNCTTWGSSADYMLEYLEKGAKITIQGRLRQNNWTDKEGTKHNSIEVVVGSIESHGSSSGSGKKSASKKSTSRSKRRDEEDYEEEEGVDPDEF